MDTGRERLDTIILAESYLVGVMGTDCRRWVGIKWCGFCAVGMCPNEAADACVLSVR